MPNMSYCRFENTLQDLRDCANNWNLQPDQDREKKARAKLYQLCQSIVEDYEDYEDYIDDECPECGYPENECECIN